LTKKGGFSRDWRRRAWCLPGKERTKYDEKGGGPLGGQNRRKRFVVVRKKKKIGKKRG